MLPVFTLLLLLVIFVLTVRSAIAALVMTGLSPQLAQLQAISAFTGVGFTTQESEEVVMHPLRRRILIWVMILGNAGFVSAASTLFLSFESANTKLDGFQRFVLLLFGAGVIWIVGQSKWLDRGMFRLIGGALRRWSESENHEYHDLFGFGDTYVVRLVKVRRGDWVVGKQLKQVRLLENEGVKVIGIQRADGTHIGLPHGSTTIEAGDEVVLYGRHYRLEELLRDSAGDNGDDASPT